MRYANRRPIRFGQRLPPGDARRGEEKYGGLNRPSLQLRTARGAAPQAGAAEISDSAGFSASVTFVPPKPMNPPSASASATFWLIWQNQCFTAAASSGGFASRSADACFRASRHLAFNSAPMLAGHQRAIFSTRGSASKRTATTATAITNGLRSVTAGFSWRSCQAWRCAGMLKFRRGTVSAVPHRNPRFALRARRRRTCREGRQR